jgi:hypothetical protein
MAIIDGNPPPTYAEIEHFLKSIDFRLPHGFIDFYKKTNGADIRNGNTYVILWPITSLIRLNKDYDVATYAPEFFMFGSNGGDTAYAIERMTGYIFEMPFIGISKEEAVLRSKTFDEFLAGL